MSNIILTETDWTYQWAYVSWYQWTITELKSLKQKDWRTAYEVTQEQLDQIEAGWTVSIVDWNVQITE